MGNINVGRMVLGGLVAGVVLNFGGFVLHGILLAEQWAAAMQRLNLTPDGGMMGWIVWSFLLGIVMNWVYAGMRTRFGAGPKTAAITGLTCWFILEVLGFAGNAFATGMFPGDMVGMALIGTVIYMPIAAIVGASLYKED